MISGLFNTESTASPFYIRLVVVLCVITMSVLTIAVIWQAQIIANQSDSIKWLETIKFGG